VDLLTYIFVQMCKVYNGWLDLYLRDDVQNNLFRTVILSRGRESPKENDLIRTSISVTHLIATSFIPLLVV